MPHNPPKDPQTSSSQPKSSLLGKFTTLQKIPMPYKKKGYVYDQIIRTYALDHHFFPVDGSIVLESPEQANDYRRSRASLAFSIWLA